MSRGSWSLLNFALLFASAIALWTGAFLSMMAPAAKWRRIMVAGGAGLVAVAVIAMHITALDAR